MNSTERHAARYERRKAKREQKRMEHKAPYDSIDSVCDANHLIQAEHNSRNGVSWKASVQKYEMNMMRNIWKTRRALQNGEDVRQGFIEFDLYERGKARHIKSMHFYERVVQRSVCDHALVPVLTRSLVYDNGASLKGKGIHFAIFRAKHHLQEYYRRYGTNEGYILLMDFSSYFDRIQHKPIYDLVNRSFDDEKLKRLILSFVDAFGLESLGIGSQVSQIFAVSYPNRVDHYVREVLHMGLAQRYMDDSYIIARTREELEEVLAVIRPMYDELGIVLSERKTMIIPLKRFTFLKVRYLLTDTGKVIMKPNPKAFTRMRRKLRKFRAMVDNGVMTMEQVRTAYNSFYGYNQHLDCHKSLRQMDKLYYDLFGEKPNRRR